MGSSQRRIGPFNIGWYGILSSIINGCNLIKTQLIIPKLHFYLGYECFPMLFLLFSIINYNILYPFIFINLMVSIVIVIILSGLSIVFIILCAFSGCSKYSILGCIRIISQLISFELIWTTILLIFIWSFNEISIAGFNNLYLVILLLIISYYIG
jgi:NADH:ubiquinone oxidoreductase subunit H